MRTVWIDFVEPGGRSGGSEVPEARAFATARQFLAEYDLKGLPAGVVLQPLERSGPSLAITGRGPIVVTFNRLGKTDRAVEREAKRLKTDAVRALELARTLANPINPREWLAGIARLNIRARTRAISKKSKKKRRQ